MKKCEYKCDSCDDTGYQKYFPWPNCDCKKGKELKCWHCGDQECPKKYGREN